MVIAGRTPHKLRPAIARFDATARCRSALGNWSLFCKSPLAADCSNSQTVFVRALTELFLGSYARENAPNVMRLRASRGEAYGPHDSTESEHSLNDLRPRAERFILSHHEPHPQGARSGATPGDGRNFSLRSFATALAPNRAASTLPALSARLRNSSVSTDS